MIVIEEGLLEGLLLQGVAFWVEGKDFRIYLQVLLGVQWPRLNPRIFKCPTWVSWLLEIEG